MSVSETMEFIGLLKKIKEVCDTREGKPPKAKPKSVHGAYPGAGVTDDQGTYAWVRLSFDSKPLLC